MRGLKKRSEMINVAISQINNILKIVGESTRKGRSIGR